MQFDAVWEPKEERKVVHYIGRLGRNNEDLAKGYIKGPTHGCQFIFKCCGGSGVGRVGGL